MPEAAEAPLASRIVRGGVAVAVSSYGLLVFGFLSNLVLTRVLLPSDFGIYSLGFFFSQSSISAPSWGLIRRLRSVPKPMPRARALLQG